MVFKFNFAVGESAKAETDGEKSGSASSRECAEANLKPFSEVFPEDNSTTGTVRGEEHCVNGVKLTKVCVSTDQARSLTGIEEVACNDLLPGRYEGMFPF
uniref:Uncharacterized protein n=1 Tax=Tetraselmis sp. GSL018 TaxID=582737 RepID=A0A061S1W6_9CHLO